MESLGTLGVVGILIVAFAIAVAINAMVLKAACRMVGAAPPTIKRGAAMVVLAMFVHVTAAFLFNLVVMWLLRVGDEALLRALVGMLGLLVLIVAPAWVYKLMLPASLGRAMMIYLVHLFVLLAATVTLLVIALALTTNGTPPTVQP